LHLAWFLGLNLFCLCLPDDLPAGAGEVHAEREEQQPEYGARQRQRRVRETQARVPGATGAGPRQHQLPRVRAQELPLAV